MAECGTRARYVRGCRCEPCTAANRVYARELDRHKRRVAHGIEDPVVRFVDATETREHLLWLRSFGVGKRTVHKLTGISTTTLWEIVRGDTLKVHPDTETKILDLWRDTRNDAMIVDADSTWKRINWLQQQGWSKARIVAGVASRMGRSQKTPRQTKPAAAPGCCSYWFQPWAWLCWLTSWANGPGAST